MSGNRKWKAAFTLVEVTIALAIIGTMGAGCYIGFNSLNQYAISSRLYSEAQTVAQNQIDLILSKEPFSITNNQVPDVLGGGTCQCTPVTAGSSRQITTPNVFVYEDPVTGNAVVVGTMTTTITNPGETSPFISSTNLNLYRANVTVTYTYRNTPYSVSMDTMRTADQ